MTSETLALVPFTFALGNFLAQGWAAKKIFRKIGDREPIQFLRMKIVATLCMAGLLVAIWRHPASRASLVLLGAALLLISSAVFLAALKAKKDFGLSLAFSEDQPESLLTSGIYQFIRHPFYCSYILSYLGAGLAVDSPLALLPAVLMAVWYYFAASLEERKFSNSALRSNYSKYRSDVGMFFPKIAALFFLLRRGGSHSTENQRR